MIQFNLNGGSGNIASQTVYYNDMALPPAGTFSRPGYRFLGWSSIQAAGSNLFDFPNTPITANHTLYAQWELSPSVESYSGTNIVGIGLWSRAVSLRKSTYLPGENPYLYGPALRISNVPTSGQFSIHVGIRNRTYSDETDGAVDIEHDDILLESFARDGDSIEIYLSTSEQQSSRFVFIYKPYEIRLWQDLQGFSFDRSGTYILKNNITLPTGYNFEPIGNNSSKFTGTINGAGLQ